MPHQSPRRRAWLAWALLCMTAVLVAAAIAIGLERGERWSAVFGFIPVVVAFTIVGALVAARTGNRLGWLFLVTGTLSAVTLVLSGYATRGATAAPPGATWAASRAVRTRDNIEARGHTPARFTRIGLRSRPAR